MVCDRCKIVVKNILETSGLEYKHVDLGKVTLYEAPGPEKQQELKKRLEEVGFEIIDDRRSRIVEKIKKSIIDLVYHHLEDIKVNYSVYLEREVGMDYNYLSNLFSETEGHTIEKYIILQKIERVKELLVYEQLTLSEIAFIMGYSSVSHLSSQFKWF